MEIVKLKKYYVESSGSDNAQIQSKNRVETIVKVASNMEVVIMFRLTKLGLPRFCGITLLNY